MSCLYPIAVHISKDRKTQKLYVFVFFCLLWRLMYTCKLPFYSGASHKFCSKPIQYFGLVGAVATLDTQMEIRLKLHKKKSIRRFCSTIWLFSTISFENKTHPSDLEVSEIFHLIRYMSDEFNCFFFFFFWTFLTVRIVYYSIHSFLDQISFYFIMAMKCQF